MKVVECDKHPHLCLFAIRDIAKEDELRYDYGVKDLWWRQQKILSTDKSGNLTNDKPRVETLVTMTDHKTINNVTSTNEEIILKLPVTVNILHDTHNITLGSNLPSDSVEMKKSKEHFVREDQTHDVMSHDQLNHERLKQSISQELSSNSPYLDSSCAPTDNMAYQINHGTSRVDNLTNDKPCADKLFTMIDHIAINNVTLDNQAISSKMSHPVNILHDRQTIVFGSDIMSDFVELQMSKENFVPEDQMHDVMSNDQLNHERFNQSNSQELSSYSPHFESSCAPTDKMAYQFSHGTSSVGCQSNRESLTCKVIEQCNNFANYDSLRELSNNAFHADANRTISKIQTLADDLSRCSSEIPCIIPVSFFYNYCMRNCQLLVRNEGWTDESINEKD